MRGRRRLLLFLTIVAMMKLRCLNVLLLVLVVILVLHRSASMLSMHYHLLFVILPGMVVRAAIDLILLLVVEQSHRLFLPFWRAVDCLLWLHVEKPVVLPLVAVWAVVLAVLWAELLVLHDPL